ncbi:M23 family metallopeptidase [Flavobacterium glaciei]|uniref:Peptidase M23-like protein n=1 Tax=Flavobacterium glaciei TaxID=386300 RepID=A0A562PRE2_9FLAO|nr:M23 family metallopeptidase [Flavobacterium glaciei]RDI53791.1 peptidase M23-like protein [Flavobacterium glaciei]TWI47017.1 peptidase M23-like protein [Flavobacterium glaciei]
MKFLIFIAFSLTTLTTSLFAQTNVKFYHEMENGAYKVFADNNEVCEVSVLLSYDLLNMKNVNPANKPIVIPANAKKYLIDQINVVDRTKKSKFSFQSQIHLGNITKSSYDKDFLYTLPFKTGEVYEVYQGYYGSFSHKNENALDFTMKIGTAVTAIREGIVVKTVTANSLGCKDESCKQYNNYIIILHPDGTFVEYTHIQKNGSKVKVGDLVKQGDVIALSGNTGWSSGPHLHLVVYLPTSKGRQTLQTIFKTGDGQTREILSEKKKYNRNY